MNKIKTLLGNKLILGICIAAVAIVAGIGITIGIAAINVEEDIIVAESESLGADKAYEAKEISQKAVMARVIKEWEAEEERKAEEEAKRLAEEAARAEAIRREMEAEEARARAEEAAARAAEEAARKEAEEAARRAAEEAAKQGNASNIDIKIEYPSKQIVKPGEQIVICLDPGHGGSEKGAYYTYNGLTVLEKDINYSIAVKLKQKLEAAGIRVIMTRNGDSYIGLYDRVKLAKDNGAHFFISLHNNASSRGLPEHKGCLAIVTQSNYNDVKGDSLALAYSILGQLNAMGINFTSDWASNVNNGILQRIDEPVTYYPDESVADWYGITRNSTYQGLPSVLVEHAFLSNESDYNNYLSSEDKLDKLAQADANGILNYLRGKGYI